MEHHCRYTLFAHEQGPVLLTSNPRTPNTPPPLPYTPRWPTPQNTTQTQEEIQNLSTWKTYKITKLITVFKCILNQLSTIVPLKHFPTITGKITMITQLTQHRKHPGILHNRCVACHTLLPTDKYVREHHTNIKCPSIQMKYYSTFVEHEILLSVCPTNNYPNTSPHKNNATQLDPIVPIPHSKTSI